MNLGFHGVKVTSDAGILAYREIDDTFELIEMAACKLTEERFNIRTILQLILTASVILVNFDVQGAERLIDAPEPLSYRIWNTQPPADCPFERSETLLGLGFTGKSVNYGAADTWYPSWAKDGKLYSPFTDGNANKVSAWSIGERAVVGFTVMEAENPYNLKFGRTGIIAGDPEPYGGRYPCANLFYDGVWYIGTYGLAGENYGLNWPILGPFAGFHISKDAGETWTPSPLSCHSGKALFPEPEKFKGPVKIGAPHVVDFGRNMEHSPDGKAYLIGHGSTEQDEGDRQANLSWISGDQIYLCRVKPHPQNINDESKYEYFAGHDNLQNPIWSKDFEDIKPLYEWDNNCGCVTMTYNSVLKKYLMCVTDGWPTVKNMRTYILESDKMTGPYKLVAYLANFGPQGYFVNIPSKFVSSDGRTLWLCYSANFTYGGDKRSDPALGNPYGSSYSLTLQEVRLLDSNEVALGSPLFRENNIAPAARIKASSTFKDYDARAVADGIVAGYPDSPKNEWASLNEKEGAFIQLYWDEPKVIDRVWLFDRPWPGDSITKGMLVFNDGTVIKTGPLPNDAKQGLEISFEPKTVSRLIFFVEGVSEHTQNIGLAEIAVFQAESN